MTDVSRGARSRRGGRGTGWFLLTSLLVLAILASSTLVFTNRVELLRLAVVLALWAAVVAAFVTVIYRRQSELDQARARDMKFVYDLQLDREISARREYELSVESQLRRTLSREIRAEAADEMAALRAELVALRSQLEVMLGADLGHRPALESERIVIPMPAAPGRVESSRVTVVAEEFTTVARETVTEFESPIIDVPEEPLIDAVEVPVVAVAPPVEPVVPQDYRGSHRRPVEGVVYPPIPPSEPVIVGPAQSYAVTPAPPYVPTPPAPTPPAPTPPAPTPPAQPYISTAPAQPYPDAPWRPPEVRLGRHSTSDGPPAHSEPSVAPEPAPDSARGRHWVPSDGVPVIPGRHRGPEDEVAEPVLEEPQGQHAGGQSFADLMARFQVNPASGGGGGRRRRED